MMRYFKDLMEGGWSLLVGLGETFKAFCQPVVTVQYPREKIDVTPNYRGHTDLVRDPETGTHRCIVCGLCMKQCPSQCIKLKGSKVEGVKGKVLDSYHLNFTTCSLCGICVEICPTSALEFSQAYELAGFTREEFHFDLLQRLKERK